MESFEISKLRQDWSIQTKTGFGLAPQGYYLRGTKGRPQDAGRLCMTYSVVKLYQKLTCTCIAVDFYLGYTLNEGLRHFKARAGHVTKHCEC